MQGTGDPGSATALSAVRADEAYEDLTLEDNTGVYLRVNGVAREVAAATLQSRCAHRITQRCDGCNGDTSCGSPGVPT